MTKWGTYTSENAQQKGALDRLCLRLSPDQSTAKNDKSTVLQIVRDRPIVVATVS